MIDDTTMPAPSKPVAGPVQRPVRQPMSDAQLMADLDQIEAEVRRRKKAYPLEPYAVWAMNARMEALARFNARQVA